MSVSYPRPELMRRFAIAGNAPDDVKATSGFFLWADIFNAGTGPSYLQIHNVAEGSVSGSTIVATFAVPAGTSRIVAPYPIPCARVTMRITTTRGGTTNSSETIDGEIWYA